MQKDEQLADGAASDLSGLLDLTSEDLENLRHMVGAVKNVPKKQWGYRNHFAPADCDIPSMERLLKAGFVTKGKKYHVGVNNYYYHATLEGCKAIGLTKAATKRALEDW